MIAFQIEWKATAEALKQAEQRHARQYEAGMIEAAKFVLTVAQSKVPVDTGFLRESGIHGHLGAGLSTISYVGFTAPYAVYVHEIPATHLVGEDKYLEKAVQEAMFNTVLIMQEAMS